MSDADPSKTSGLRDRVLPFPAWGEVLRTIHGAGVALAAFGIVVTPIALVAYPFTTGGFVDPAGLILNTAGWIVAAGVLCSAIAHGLHLLTGRYTVERKDIDTPAVADGGGNVE